MQCDGLTGLPTRAAFDTDLAAAVSTESTVSLALIDVNYFHDINQTFGVDAGDRVLTSIVELFREHGEGLMYRIAGDEFAVIMSDQSLEQAFLKMEELRRSVKDSAARFDLPDKRAVSIGVGVAQYPRDAKDADSLKSAAAAALGSSKENRSDHVVLPLSEEMVMKSCYYTSSSVRRLKTLAERTGKRESLLLREALLDLLRKYDTRD